MAAKINTVDNIMEAIRLLDLDNQPFIDVSSEDLVVLVREIISTRHQVRTLKQTVTNYEVRLSNAISEGLKAMSQQAPRLDVRG